MRREEQRKNRAAGEAPETEPTAPAASGSREDLIEPDPNPKRRMFMKSASLTASGFGQQKEGKAIADDESGMLVELKTSWRSTMKRAEPPGVSSTNTRRRCNEVAHKKQLTGTDTAMRIKSVEHIGLGSIMELSITGQVIRWARQPNLSGGVSLRKSVNTTLRLTFSRCKSVHMMSTGKGHNELIQYDNKLELETSYKLLKFGPI